MKRTVLSLSIFASLAFASCSDKPVVTPVQPTVSKTVEFRIVPTQDYTHSYFNGATAEVKLSVYKQFSNPYSTSVIWDTVISKQALSNYMSMPNPNVITKTFTGLKENEYRIGVSYSIGYVSAPPLSANSWSGMGELINIGDNVNHVVPVGL
jgi:hypothetical protein